MAHLHKILVSLICDYEVVSFSRFKAKRMLAETRNIFGADTRPITPI
jgi:hypothetical protein